jgi:hypothetical protein
MLTAPQLVQITSTGKVRIIVSRNVLAIINHLISQVVLGVLEYEAGKRLDRSTCKNKVYYCLISEIYTKHFATLHLMKSGKMLLTMAQALAFWEMCQEFDQVAFRSAEMGGLLAQLHQKLS